MGNDEVEEIRVASSDSKGVIIEPNKDYLTDGYTYSIAPCRFFLRALGAWSDPFDERSLLTSVRVSIIMLTMLFFATFSQSIKMALTWQDLNVVMEILSNCNLPTSIAAVKIASIWYHRHVLSDLLRQIVRDWDASTHSEQDSRIMWRKAKISRYFTIGCIFMTESTLVAQCLVGLLEPISYAIGTRNSSESAEYPLYMMGWFPYDVQKTPNYELTIVGQFVSNVFASTSFSSADSFFVVLMFHLIGQLAILERMILDLPRKIETEDDRKEFMERFSAVIERHNQLWRFSTAIEDVFNMMFFIQIVPCIFALCAQGYQLLLILDADSVAVVDLIFIIYFLVLFLFTILTYCYVAEILRKKSADLSYAVYSSDWTILPAKEAKLLVLVMARAQYPFRITAGKFATFSLQFYCRILKTAAGYLSMLLAVKDRMADE